MKTLRATTTEEIALTLVTVRDHDRTPTTQLYIVPTGSDITATMNDDGETARADFLDPDGNTWAGIVWRKDIDVDPYEQEPPSEPSEMADILREMLQMSEGGTQWGNAHECEVGPLGGDRFTLTVGGTTFEVAVKHAS